MLELHSNAASAVRMAPVLGSTANSVRLNAVSSWIFNLGAGRFQTSTLRRRINAEDWANARVEMLRWVRGGGRVLPGLVARRKVEAALL